MAKVSQSSRKNCWGPREVRWNALLKRRLPKRWSVLTLFTWNRILSLVACIISIISLLIFYSTCSDGDTDPVASKRHKGLFSIDFPN